METKYLSRKEKLSFTVAAFGRSGIYTIMTMFYMVFLVDVVFQGMKNAGVTASTIILAGRIFDAANDPIMGMIVDRTRTKWGKMRPYLLFSPIPIAITTILLFWAPGFASSGAKIAYAAVTYILWGVMFTIQDVPFWGLSAVITPNELERTSFLSTARLGSTFGGILPSLLIPVLRNSTLGLKNGYLVGAVIFALLGAALSSLAFFNTKERVEQSEKTPSLKESIQMVANRHHGRCSWLHDGHRQHLRRLYQQLSDPAKRQQWLYSKGDGADHANRRNRRGYGAGHGGVSIAA